MEYVHSSLQYWHPRLRPTLPLHLRLHTQSSNITVTFEGSTVVVGLIPSHNMTAYMVEVEVEMFSSWCEENYLDLNTSKTKVVDFSMKKQRIHYTPLRIYRIPVK